MEQRQLGLDGPTLTVLGLGCNNLGSRNDARTSAAIVHAALDAGITHFDTAERYGRGLSEEYLGAALGARRDDVVIATKFAGRSTDEPYRPGALALRIRDGVETSLRRLRTDRIDLYYQHHPDPDAPVEEVLDTLGNLVEAGKVAHIACSNTSAADIEAATAAADEKGRPRFTGTQIQWNLLARAVEEDVIPAAGAAGLGVVPYLPLASGLLTGKYHRGQPFPPGTRFAHDRRFARAATDQAFAKVEAYRAYAADHGHTVGELAIAWLLAQTPVTSVIVGASKPGQVVANARASEWVLTPEEAADIGAL